MTDIFSTRKRGEIMSRIRSNGTSAEQAMISIIREAIGNRRTMWLNVSQLPGCPDVVVPSLSVAIFADGCFYHGCPVHGHMPKSHKAYWFPKLRGNMRRDVSNRRKLRRLGYHVWRVWEHDLKGNRQEIASRRLRHRIDKLILIRKKSITRVI